MKTKPKKSAKEGQRKLLICLMAFAVIASIIAVLTDKPVSRKLPFLGDPVYKTLKTADGTKTDSIYPVVPAFNFIDQHRQAVNNATFKGKVYVADFFFTSCPTICPVMSRSLKKVYDHFSNVHDLMFISHTIDPKYDTPELLNRYASALGVESRRWHFVTGQKVASFRLSVAKKTFAIFKRIKIILVTEDNHQIPSEI